MKKTLLAAALLAGFATAGVAQAETSVTLYGILDTGYGYQNFKNNHEGADYRARSSGLRSGFVNGNRWGLKGAEDLGGGLSAIFTLENGFNIGTGSLDGGNMFNRQAFVGLSSDQWGALTLGRQYSAGVDTSMGEEMNGLGNFDKVAGGMGWGSGTRVNNSFKYTTPSFSGFKGVLMYGTGSTANSNSTWVIRDGNLPNTDVKDRGARLSVGASYSNGPLGIGAAYDRQSVYGQDVNGRNVNAMTAWDINGSYDFEVVKLSLMFGQDRNGKINWNGDATDLSGYAVPNLANGYQDFKSNNWGVTLSAPVGPGRLFAVYNGSHSNLKDDDKWGSKAGNINAYQLQYQYPLSKRTKIYTYASYMQNVGYVKDLKGTEAGIGINHRF